MQEVVTDPLDIQYVYYKYGYDGLVEFLQNLPDAAAAGLNITRLGREYVWGPGDGGAAGTRKHVAQQQQSTRRQGPAGACFGY